MIVKELIRVYEDGTLRKNNGGWWVWMSWI